jgi:non-specific serine/threonine protein kinase
VRFRLLETIRQYAGERLSEAGEGPAARRRHRDWCLALAERAAPELVGRDQAVWFERLATEHDNLRAALEWGQQDPDGAGRHLRLTAALGRFWAVRQPVGEGCAWLAGALARPGPRSLVARVTALAAAGRLEHQAGNVRRARALLEEGVALARAGGDRQLLALALEPLQQVLWHFEDAPAARRALYEEALATGRAIGSPRLLATALLHLAAAAFEAGEPATARRRAEASLAVARAAGDATICGHIVVLQGRLALAAGEHGAARAHFEEAVADARTLGGVRVLALGLLGLGELATAQGAAAEAHQRYREGLVVAREAGYTLQIAEALVGCAGAWASLGQPVRAAHLLGAADAWLAVLAVPRPWTLGIDAFRTPRAAVAASRAVLGEPAFASALAEGRALTPERAVTEALSPTAGGVAPRQRARPHSAAGLSPREAEVLALVAEGRSNQEIAAALVLSVRTVERHLARIYGKLGTDAAAPRVAAAAYAVAHGLAAPPAAGGRPAPGVE